MRSWSIRPVRSCTGARGGLPNPTWALQLDAPRLLPERLGIAGEAIPIGARCLCIADSFDAMISRRSYKDAMSVDAALGEIRRNLGTQFDPKIGLAFIKMIEEEEA